MTTCAHCARKLPSLPSTLFTFPPADIGGQILNFGLPVPLDIQISASISRATGGTRICCSSGCAVCPAPLDLRVHQVFDHPNLEVNVDRSKAALFGVTSATCLEPFSFPVRQLQTTPSFWIDPDRVPVQRHRKRPVQADLPV